MMFLIRTAFWLSVVVLLLPTPESMKAPESSIDTTKAVSAASATVSDMRAFCERQPDACKVGSQALTAFGYKAQASAKWVYEFLTDKLGNAQTTATPSEPKAALDLGNGSQHTLTPADAAPAWRAPQRQAEAKRPQ
jgi:Family of unknown function (DUF5330)